MLGDAPPAERPLLRPGARGPAVLELKRALVLWAERHGAPRFALGTGYGKAAAVAVRAFQEEAGLVADALVGPGTWAALDAVVQASAPALRPPLPTAVSFPADGYPPASGWSGLQPWIAPQVRAICDRFGLRLGAGWGGHPPHARRSDHRWGGACDLVGPRDGMAACSLWADGLRAAPWRRDAVFRWVGGPAADADGPEPGHLDHVHLSWFREGPATTVFGTAGFS
jgi:hypothetical protein